MLASMISLDELRPFLHYVRELPIVWFLIGCLLAKAGLALVSRLSPRDRSALLRRIAFAAGVLVLVTYLAITLFSLRSFMIQQDEANILSIAAAGLHGQPMYHLPISPDYSYSLMYGPFTFLIYRAALIAGGVNHFWILRGVVVLANLGFCAALYVILRRFVSTFTAIALLAFPLSILMQHPEISLSLRADIWIILFATLAILGGFLEAELPAVILVGIMGGLIVGLKISAAPAILYPLLLLYRKFRLRAVITSSLLAVATSLIPFVATDISLRNYIAWISFTRSEGISLASVWMNILFALFLMSPCLIMGLYMRRFRLTYRQRLPELLLILLCLFLAVMTSKNGSGPHYLWHIVPSILVYVALLSRDMKDIPSEAQALPVYYIAVACALFACINVPRAWEHVKTSRMPPSLGVAQQSIDRYLERYRDHSSVQMGYGSVDGDYLPELRYILVDRGQPYTIEGNTGRFETKLLPFPVHVLNQMENCKNDVWLIPHAQQPFEVWVFPNVLHKTFVENYRVDRTDGVYDAWVCDRAKDHEGS